MALWMTVEQECLGLAALLLVLSCTLLCGWSGIGRFGKAALKSRGKEKGRRLAFFVVFLGMCAGAVRMEYEEWTVAMEQKVVGAALGEKVRVSGRVAEIQEVDSGVRMQLEACELIGIGEVRRMYCYTESADGIALGERILAWGICKLPEPDRNPGGFDYRLYCLSRGICGMLYADLVEKKGAEEGTGAVAISVAVMRLETIYWGLRESLRQLRIILEQKIDLAAEEADAGILKAVLLGVKSDMSDEIYELYRKNGISHVLAISGLHVSVIGMGLWNGLRRLGFGYTGAGIVAFGVLFGYGMIAGFGPSVVRAVFMMGVSFLAGICGRTYDLPSAMCVPAIGILLWQPYLLTQASFQLSFLAVGAMFFPGRYLAKDWKLKGTPQNLMVSLSLQMATMPVVLSHSYEIPAYGILLNLMVVPLMTYVLVSVLLGITGSFLWSGLGVMFLGGAHYILEFYKVLCLGMQKIPGANLILGSPGWMDIGVFYVCLAGGAWLAVHKAKRWLVLWGIGFLLLLLRPQYGLAVTFLDVGQGDGIFLEYGSGYGRRTMLVDCGSSQERSLGEDVLAPFLKSQGVGRLDTVVVSHGDQDHVSGIRYLLEEVDCEIEIGEIVMAAAGRGDEVIAELGELAEKRGIGVRYLGAGESLTGCLGNEVEILCVHPGERAADSPDRNENSLVLQLTYRNFSMLLTGDIGEESEQKIMETTELGQITVLKAAHHGSAASTGREFLEKIRPAYVIFSYGEGNSYGHPSPYVVERCREIGAETWETAQTGAITMRTDGENLRIDGWLDRHGGI